MSIGELQKHILQIFHFGVLLFILSFPVAALHPLYIGTLFGLHPSLVTFCAALITIGIAFLTQYLLYREGLSELLVGLCLTIGGSSFLYAAHLLAQNPQANAMPFAALFFVAVILGIGAALAK